MLQETKPQILQPRSWIIPAANIQILPHIVHYFYGIFQQSCLLPRIKQLKREGLIVWQIHSQSQHFQIGGSTTPQTYFDMLVAFSGLFESNPIKITVWTVQKHFLTCKSMKHPNGPQKINNIITNIQVNILENQLVPVFVNDFS